MSRRVYRLGVALALVALAFAVTDALLRRPGVTEANVHRVRPGMSPQEVAAVLGGRPDLLWHNRGIGGWCGIWEGQQGSAPVAFSNENTVTEAVFDGPQSPSLLARLRAWLGW